jgi:general secretion pathway protein A
VYTQFYGFSEGPFNDTPDPKFLFLAESHQTALDSLLFGINQGRGFISLLGEAGTGKTILIYQLLNRFEEQVKTVFIFHPQITFEDLLKKIMLELNLSVSEPNQASLLLQFSDFLIQSSDHNERIVIFIDEAQNLRSEVLDQLQALSSLETSRSNVLQLVLVGQPELEIKLNARGLRQLNQKIKIRCQIKPLTEEESFKYIDHRLKLVGSSGPEVFTPEALSLICRNAAGIPRSINLICDNALRIGFQLSDKKIDVSIVRMVFQRMYIQERPATFPRAFKKNVWPRKIHYSVLSLIGVGLVIFLGREYIKGPAEKPESKTLPKPSIVAGKIATPASGIKDDSSSGKVPSSALEQKPAAPKPPQPVAGSSSPLAQPQAASVLRKDIIVEKGATLSFLCQERYRLSNLTLMDHILEYNPKILNPHLILTQQRIQFPEITDSSLIIESSDGTYKVHLGTFWTVEYAGRYKDEPALRGKSIEIIPRKVSPGETWYRVMAEKFSNREESLEAIRALKQKGLLPIFRGSLKK